MERTGGTETSQYPQEEKEIIDSLSSGDRTGKSPNRCCYGIIGVVGPFISYLFMKWNVLESSTIDGDSPVHVNEQIRERHLSRAGHVKSAVNLPGPPGKPKYSLVTDSGLVP